VFDVTQRIYKTIEIPPEMKVVRELQVLPSQLLYGFLQAKTHQCSYCNRTNLVIRFWFQRLVYLKTDRTNLNNLRMLYFHGPHRQGQNATVAVIP